MTDTPVFYVFATLPDPFTANAAAIDHANALEAGVNAHALSLAREEDPDAGRQTPAPPSDVAP